MKLWLAFLATLALLAVAYANIASSHDERPAWLPASCCGEGDCWEVEDVKEVRGGYEVHTKKWDHVGAQQPLQGKWWPIDEVVPYDKASPSMDGKFYGCWYLDNQFADAPSIRRRCFFAPPGLT